MTTKFRYAAYAPNGPRIGDIPVPVDSSFSSTMNEVSGCTLSYLPNSAGADLLSDYVEVAVEASVDNGASWDEIPNGRYMRRDREYEKIALLNARKYTLPGYAWQLNKSIVWETTGLNEDGKRPFLSATVGIIIKTLIDEAHARDTILGLDYDFDTILDSAGIAWDKIITIYYEPTLSIYQILDNLSQQGMCDWRMQGRTLQIYNADTVMGEDHSEDVRLQPGVDIKALPIKASIENLVNKALVLGDEGVTLELSNPAVFMPWGNWETSISNAGVTDPGTMTLLGTALLEDGGAEKVQFTAELKMDTTTYFPFSDFLTGHYISGPSEAVGGFQPYRVRQINGRSGKDGKFQVDLIVNDRFVEREIRNAKKTNGIVGGASAGGSGGRPTPPPNPGEGQDTRQPAQVVGLVLDTDVYTDFYGRPAGTISATWAAVTTATDATALDVVGYEVAIRNGLTGIWYITATVEDTDWEESSYIPGATYQIKVRAIGKYTTTPGVWSSTETIVVASDVTPPSVPSVPILATRLGVITVTWDGNNDVGADMQADWSHNEVAMGTTATPTSVIAEMDAPGFIPVTDQPYGENRYFRFRSVDTSDNPSAWSVAASIMATSVVDDDLVDSTIQASIEEALTGQIDGSRLDPWTVLGNKVIIGDVDNRIPWNPEVSLDPHLPSSGTVLSRYLDPDIGWIIQFFGGTGTNGIMGPGIILQSGSEDGLFPVEPGRSYRIGAHIGAGGSFPISRLARVTVAWYDQFGAYLGSYFGPDVTPPFTGTATSSALFTAPVDAFFCQIEVWKNTWTGVGEYKVFAPYMILAASAELIVDGSIIASKIAADAVTASKIAANSITAGKINAGAIDGMVITGATIRTAPSGGRIEMNSSEFSMYDGSATKQLSITPGAVWMTTLDLRTINVGRGMTALDGSKIVTFSSAAVPAISSMVPGIGAGKMLLVESMQYDPVLAAGRIEMYILNSGAVLGGTNAYLLFGNRRGDGTARYLGTGGLNVDNAPQIVARSQGLLVGENVNEISFQVKGDGPAYVGGTTYPTNGSGIISFQRAASTWTPATTSKPRITMAAGEMQIYVTGAAGFRVDSSVSAVAEQAGSNPTTVFIANTNGCYLGHDTTTNAANTNIGTNGNVFRSTSARKYKTDIQDLDLDPRAVLGLRPRTWVDKLQLSKDPDNAPRIPGFVAEEVEEVGLGIFVTYHGDEVEGLSYDRISAAHHLVIKDHDARLALLEAENRELRALIERK